MDMEMLNNLKKKLCKNLEGYAEIQQLGGRALEDVGMMVKTIKNIGLIEEQENGQKMGASQRGYFMGSYNDDASYRRGRDSMGRYVSREGDGDASMRGSYGHSYENGKHEAMNQLQDMMQKSQDPDVHRAIQEAMRNLEGRM